MQSTPRVVVFLSSEPRAASQKSKNGANCSKNGGVIKAERGKKTFVLRFGFGAGFPHASFRYAVTHKKNKRLLSIYVQSKCWQRKKKCSSTPETLKQLSEITAKKLM